MLSIRFAPPRLAASTAGRKATRRVTSPSLMTRYRPHPPLTVTAAVAAMTGSAISIPLARPFPHATCPIPDAVPQHGRGHDRPSNLGGGGSRWRERQHRFQQQYARKRTASNTAPSLAVPTAHRSLAELAASPLLCRALCSSAKALQLHHRSGGACWIQHSAVRSRVLAGRLSAHDKQDALASGATIDGDALHTIAELRAELEAAQKLFRAEARSRQPGRPRTCSSATSAAVGLHGLVSYTDVASPTGNASVTSWSWYAGD